MQVELTRDLQNMVQQAVFTALVSKLDTVLPEMIEQMLNAKGEYRNESTVSAALRKAVREEIAKSVGEFMADRKDMIRTNVRIRLEQMFNAGAIADAVTEQMASMKFAVSPFMAGKKATPIDEDDE